MRILWIEDDPDITAELFFGKEILRSHDVLTIRDFEDAHNAAGDINATENCFWKLRDLGLI